MDIGHGWSHCDASLDSSHLASMSALLERNLFLASMEVSGDREGEGEVEADGVEEGVREGEGVLEGEREDEGDLEGEADGEGVVDGDGLGDGMRQVHVVSSHSLHP
jgi:hypothetical protein